MTAQEHIDAQAPDDRVKELKAELAATEIAIAEYRQQCLDNAAEIARLRAESEERLQNCAALVAENERLRAEVTRPESTDMTLMRALVQSQATELERLRKDAERIDWMQRQDGTNLINDDGGSWAVSTSGFQPVPKEGGFKSSVTISSFVFPKDWKPTIRDAIDAAMKGTP